MLGRWYYLVVAIALAWLWVMLAAMPTAMG